MEIEVKAKIDDKERVVKALLSLGFTFLRKEFHEDIYFNGIDRDFKETDEALRVRDSNGKYFLTYKGPKLDKISKSREEIEVEVKDKEKMIKILEKLGFKKVRVIKKVREVYKLNDITACIDEVEGLGLFLELEKEGSLEDVEKLLNILDKLNLRNNIIRKSYLELLEEGIK
ncbi:class IV adenylate cyclase [Methanocaldococcus infernus]|uniref:Adenylyl cyclase CyaB n=1 Tax=Methanocaldococcus infernus (strain DSM 11812 / JCM 15783 / ME) TaxID=573063 RepID=D5VSK8_METIM|nr:class IV adenylate cyclase [Methanocaldococcus infernus]ADG13561.1 adenylyl cyclase CyaB [Methanocaldococcus infernus ME]